MKIGIDISQAVYGTGVSVYTQNFVRALLRLDQKNEYILFGGSLRLQDRLREFIFSLNYDPRRLRYKIFPFPPTAADFIWNQLHLLPIEKLIGPVDIFHSSDWSQPPSASAKVTTIHDLSFLRWPETVNPRVLAVQKRRLEWVKKENVQIIAVSLATKMEIETLMKIPGKRIAVVYEALPEDIMEYKRLVNRENRIKKMKEKYGITKSYFFAYGSSSPRKNIESLIRAYSLMPERNNFQLVICGEYRPTIKLPPGVVVTGFISRPALLDLFSAAVLFAYPSFYEGFGIPILEAFALEVPVLTANRSSMAEIAADAAVLIDPDSVESLIDGLRKITKETKTREILIKRGLKRLKDFSWEKTAAKTLEVYYSVYGR